MILRTFLATVAMVVAVPSAAGEVSISKQRLPDGSHVLAHEVTVAAPAERVWTAISSAEGWKSWAVPVAWSVAPDILEGSYDKSARPNDKTTIRQQILFLAPARSMVFRTVKVPEGFPDFATYSKVTSLFEVEPVDSRTSRVRLTGSGYADTESGRKLLGFFEQGNKESLERLRDSFVPAVEPTAKATGLGPLSFLVGHCWRGEFKGRGHVDTHCYEPIYGGKHIRDRHEVTGGKDIYRGETIYSWNAQLGRVEYTYWTSTGGVSRGTMIPKGEVLDFGDETHTRADGSKLVISTLIRRNGDQAYDTVSITNGVTGERVVTYRRTD